MCTAPRASCVECNVDVTAFGIAEIRNSRHVDRSDDDDTAAACIDSAVDF